jgi:hypothetical protein
MEVQGGVLSFPTSRSNTRPTSREGGNDTVFENYIQYVYI